MNWSFLEWNSSDKISVILKILSRQGVKSPSARKLLQEKVSSMNVDVRFSWFLARALPGNGSGGGAVNFFKTIREKRTKIKKIVEKMVKNEENWAKKLRKKSKKIRKNCTKMGQKN